MRWLYICFLLTEHLLGSFYQVETVHIDLLVINFKGQDYFLFGDSKKETS